MKYLPLLLVLIILVSCSGGSPTQAPIPLPTVAPTPMVEPTLIPLVEIDLTSALLQPSMLTLGGTMPIDAWQQCLIESPISAMGAIEEAGIAVVDFALIKWENGECDSDDDSTIEIYEYIWIAETERDAARLASRLEEVSEQNLGAWGVPALTSKRVERTQLDGISILTLDIDGGQLGKATGSKVSLSLTNVITRYEQAVVQLGISTKKMLIEEDYLDIAQSAITAISQTRSGKNP